MKIDRSKVTPEIMRQMRETLLIGGADVSDKSDEWVIEGIEKLMEVMVELFRVITETVVKPTIVFVDEFAHSPSMQELVRVHEAYRQSEGR